MKAGEYSRTTGPDTVQKIYDHAVDLAMSAEDNRGDQTAYNAQMEEVVTHCEVLALVTHGISAAQWHADVMFDVGQRIREMQEPKESLEQKRLAAQVELTAAEADHDQLRRVYEDLAQRHNQLQQRHRRELEASRDAVKSAREAFGLAGTRLGVARKALQ